MVGIGPSDFSLMEMFQNTSQVRLKSLVSTSREASRDNVFFAALRKQKYTTGTNSAVVQETLAALSRQLIEYMKLEGIAPNSPRSRQPNDAVERLLEQPIKQDRGVEGS